MTSVSTGRRLSEALRLDDPLLSYRDRFPILETCTYLVSHSLGAMPVEAEARLQDYARMWRTRGVRAWEEGWWEMPVVFGDLVARVIGAPRGTVTMHQNTSLATAVILSCFEFRKERAKIVLEDLEFPSVQYVYEAARRRGAEIVRIPSDDGGVSCSMEKLLAAIDERTLLVPLSLVLFRTATVQDAAAVIKKAHSVGALVVLDCYQATGTVPFDATALDADFVVGGSVKWVCGGPGAAYLYASPKVASRLEPAITGWMADEHPFDFHVGAVRYRSDAWRFLNGTPSVPALFAAEAGWKIVAEIGVQKIREKSLRQTQRLIEAAREAGFPVKSPLEPERRGGTVVIDVPDGKRVCDELIRREFLVDHRPGAGIRAAPHFYTKDSEIDAFVAELVKLARR
jgi:kynureninase